MNLFQKIGAKIFNIKQEVQTRTPLDAEAIKKDETIKELTQKLRAYEAQFAKIIANEREKAEKDKSEDKEQELIARIIEQGLEIKQQQTGSTVSFKKVFFKLFTDKKFRESIEIMDKDGTTVFGKFGDLLIMEGGYIGITDSEGNILTKGRNIAHVLFKPESFANDLVKAKRILIARDKNGNFVPDIENEEVRDISYDEKKKEYMETEERRVKVKEAIIEREERIRELSSEVERLEIVQIDLRKKLEDNTRALSIYKNRSDTAQSELQLAMQKGMQYEEKYGDMQRENAKLLELKATNETLLSMYKSMLENLRDKMNLTDTSTFMEMAQAKLQEMLDYAYSKTPTVIQQITQPEPQPRQIPQPGQVLPGRTG